MSKKKEYTFLWFIENFCFFWQKNGEALISPVFTTSELEGTAWTLRLYLKGKYDNKKDWIAIHLHRNDEDGPDTFTINYNISIIAEDGSTGFNKKYTSKFSKEMERGWSFLEMNEIFSQLKAAYLPNDILTVRCTLLNGDENVDKVAPIYGRTRIGIGYISFHHTVQGFSALEPYQKRVHRIHSHPQMGRVRSCLYLSDGSCCEEKLMVEITPSRSGQILVKCDIYLLEASGKRTKCAEADNRFDVTRREIRKLPLSLTKDAIMNKKSECLLDDKLSLLCECVFSTGIEFQKIEGIPNEITTAVGKLAIDYPHTKYANISIEKLSVCPNALDDMKEIYSSKFLSDVMLKTKENSYPAHKIVLCARSPVFKVMMSNDMKEKNSDTILVNDLEDDTVQQLLLFIYTDNIEDLQWESASRLYYAADKYHIEKLKLICSSFLIDNLSTSTATELLLMADTHSDLDLKKAVQDFILDHDEQVFSSIDWEKLIEANPLLALKTMHLKYKT